MMVCDPKVLRLIVLIAPVYAAAVWAAIAVVP